MRRSIVLSSFLQLGFPGQSCLGHLIDSKLKSCSVRWANLIKLFGGIKYFLHCQIKLFGGIWYCLHVYIKFYGENICDFTPQLWKFEALSIFYIAKLNFLEALSIIYIAKLNFLEALSIFYIVILNFLEAFWRH
jgi:hypothetical protein